MGYKEESELIRMAISSLAADKMGEHIYLLEEKVNRVRELHNPRDGQCSYCYDLNWSYEGLDNQDTSYPCPTIQALDGENNDH